MRRRKKTKYTSTQYANTGQTMRRRLSHLNCRHAETTHIVVCVLWAYKWFKKKTRIWFDAGDVFGIVAIDLWGHFSSSAKRNFQRNFTFECPSFALALNSCRMNNFSWSRAMNVCHIQINTLFVEHTKHPTLTVPRLMAMRVGLKPKVCASHRKMVNACANKSVVCAERRLA